MKKIVYSFLAVFALVTLLYGISRLVYQINPVSCLGCGHCLFACPENAINYDETVMALQVDTELCTGCGACVNVCPYGAFYDDSGLGVIYGCVTSSVTGFPVRDAILQAGEYSTLTSMFGWYSFMIPSGEYDIICANEGFVDSTITGVQLELQHTCLVNFSLVPDVSINDKEIGEIYCYPNPVKIGSEVRFFGNEGQQIINIYNTKGQLVRKVSASWDLRDRFGKQVAAGVYFCQPENISKGISGKIIVVK